MVMENLDKKHPRLGAWFSKDEEEKELFGFGSLERGQ